MDWDWTKVISDQIQELMTGQDLEQAASDVAELARVSEQVVFERAWIVQLYLWAWGHRQNSEWMECALALSRQAGNFSKVAEQLEQHYHVVGAAPLLEEIALSYWDAGDMQRAIPALQRAIEASQGGRGLALLLEAATEGGEKGVKLAESVILEVATMSSGPDKSAKLLLAARLHKLSGRDSFVQILQQVVLADTSEERGFGLLESALVEAEDSVGLDALYQNRAKAKGDRAEAALVYRNAGFRLLASDVDSADLQDLGVRLLTHCLLLLNKHNLEIPGLLASLTLLLCRLGQRGERPAGVRILAKALAHPRSDDEVIWIVNTGIMLSADDQALERTTRTFEQLRARLVERNSHIFPVMPEEEANETDMGFGEQASESKYERLYTKEIECIDEDFEEMTMPWHSSEGSH